MITKEDLQSKYEGLSTEKLMEILENKGGYTELAIEVATHELAGRNVTDDDVKSYEDKKVEKVNDFLKRNIVDDLSLRQKILFYMIFIPLRFALKMNFREDGYLLKLKQADYYTYASFIAILFIGFLEMLFNMGGVIGITLWIACFVPAYLFDEHFNRRKQIIKMQKLYNIDEVMHSK